MFISETGMFHSACRCSWGEKVEWYGFKPKAHLTPAGEGQVDRSDRTALVNHSITFHVPDVLLYKAIKKAAAKYEGKTYILCVCDCVSFTAHVAEYVNLDVPYLNMTPYGLIQLLAWWNNYVAKT
jgi:hypothetical protein